MSKISSFLVNHKRLWLAPAIFLLLVCIALLVLANRSEMAPLVYTLF